MIVELTTGVTDLIAVKLPEGANSISVANSTLFYDCPGRVCQCIDLDSSGYNLLCFLRDITEVQAAAVMPEQTPLELDLGISQLDGLRFIIQDIPIYTENPYADKNGKEIPIEYFNGVGNWINGELLTMSGYKNKFIEADQHVFRNSILLVNNGEVKNA